MHHQNLKEATLSESCFIAGRSVTDGDGACVRRNSGEFSKDLRLRNSGSAE